jgi:hypothetical protein
MESFLMEILAQPQETTTQLVQGLATAPAAARIESSVAQTVGQEIKDKKSEVKTEGGANSCSSQEVISTIINNTMSVAEGSEEEQVVASGGIEMMDFNKTDGSNGTDGVDVEFDYGHGLEWAEGGENTTMQQILAALGVDAAQFEQSQAPQEQQQFGSLQDMGLWNGVGVF